PTGHLPWRLGSPTIAGRSENCWRFLCRHRAGHPVWSKNSCGLALVVFQETAESFSTMNQAWTSFLCAWRRKEQHIPLALMIPLVMIVFHILVERMPERRFPKYSELTP